MENVGHAAVHRYVKLVPLVVGTMLDPFTVAESVMAMCRK